MGEALLSTEGLNFRHRMKQPKLLNPWSVRLGPGIHDVKIKLRAGTITGLVGPNGAGKTTLIRLLSGLSLPDSGEIWLNGTLIRERYLGTMGRGKIGFMPEQVNWQGSISVQATLSRLIMMGNSGDDCSKLLKLVGLGSRAESSLDSLSMGMRQRLSLASALIGDPDILLLDEPMNGLDPVAQAAFRGLLKQLAGQGKAILLSSHQLAEMERVVNHIIILHRGRMVVEGKTEQVEKALGLGGKLLVSGIGQLPKSEFSKFSFEILEQGEEWSVCLDSETDWNVESRQELIKQLTEANNTPTAVTLQKADLSDVLAAATGISAVDISMDLMDGEEE